MQTPLSQILKGKGGDIHQVTPTTTIRQAVQVMNAHSIGSLMVHDGDRYVGIFTERDVLSRVIDAGRDPDKAHVGESMTRHPVTVDDATTLGQAMGLMKKYRFRHLPVTHGPEKEMCGILSINDLISTLVEGREHEIDQLVNYISGSY